jgi:hypothetical protein
VEESGQGLTADTTPAFARIDWCKSQKSSVRIRCVQIKMWTRHLLNTGQKDYHFGQLASFLVRAPVIQAKILTRDIRVMSASDTDSSHYWDIGREAASFKNLFHFNTSSTFKLYTLLPQMRFFWPDHGHINIITRAEEIPHQHFDHVIFSCMNLWSS